MTTNITIDKIQFKRGNEADTPLLDSGEPFVTEDTGKVLFGTPAGNKEVAKKEDLDNLNSSLSQKANVSDIDKYKDQAFRNLNYLKDNGVLVMIGDSITAGYGIANYNDMWVKKVQDFFNSYTGYNDYETITNFNECGSYGISLSGSTSIGTLGASKKSLIMQPGAVLSFTGIVNFLDFLYHQTSSSGSLEVRVNGSLYKTINCSGTDTLDKTSFPTASSNTNTSATYTVTCINASVEITGIIRLMAKGNYSNANVIRCAVSGQDTGYFNDSAVLTSIKAASNFGNAPLKNKTYLIALGTNDIYNSSVAKSAAAYSANVENMIKTLLDDSIADDVRIILTVPSIPNENTWPTIIEAHSHYRNEVYKLAGKYNLTVLDYTNIDFLSNNWFQDGLHPNPTGNEQLIEFILKTFSIEGIKKTPKNPYASTAASAQDIASGSFQSVVFSSEVNDTDNIFDLLQSSRFTINTAGMYLLQANIDFTSNATGMRALVFRINGSTFVGNFYQNAVNGSNTAMSACKLIKLNKGDYVEVQVYQTSGANLSLGSCEASIAKVA